MGTRSIFRRKETNGAGRTNGVIFLGHRLNENFMGCAIVLFIFFLVATWSHWYQRPTEYLLEYQWIKKLKKKESVLLSEYFIGDSQVCFLPPYSRGWYLPVSEKLKESIGSAVSSTSKTEWWIVAIRNNELEKAYKMSTKIRMSSKKDVCVLAKNGMLSYNKESNYSISFHINNGEGEK